MGFYYAAEKKRFDRKWDKLRREYVAAGMTAEAIQHIYEFDWACFCSQRTYANHTQTLPGESVSDDEAECSTLFRKYINNMASFDDMSTASRYAWVESIENQQLISALRKLSDEDLELLTFLVLEEHTQRELAQKWGWSQKAVSRRFLRIKKFLGKAK